jgi:hypothetical protein
MPPTTHPVRLSIGVHRRLVALSALGHIDQMGDYASEATLQRMERDGLLAVADRILAASEGDGSSEIPAEPDRPAASAPVSSPERAAERA